MKKRTTRCLALLLAVVMILSAMPVAMAEGTTQTTWTKTTLSDIKAADTIAITMTKDNKTWILPTTGEGKKKQPLATEVAVTGSTLTTSGSNGFGWTIAATEGGYHIKTGSKYLYLTADNNGMRIGKTISVWSLSDDHYLTAKDSNNTSRYLGVYKGEDWRCYDNTTGNIADQTLTFWKLEPARTNGIIALKDIKNGDTVVIFNPANGKALSTEYTGFYNNGTDVTLTEDKLTGWTKTDLWTVGVNEDGTYTFSTSEGKKLSMQDTRSSMPLESSEATHSDWSVTAVTGKTNTYYIDNVYRAAVSGNKNYRMQWDARTGNLNWSTYNGTGELFEQQFYLVVDSGEEPDPDPDPEPTPSALFKDGEKIVIYNPANMKALSSEYTGNYNKGTDVTMDNGTLSGWTEADVWTVGVNEDGTYTFSTSEGKKLSMTTQYSSMPLDKENPNWEVTTAKTENCFYIKNTGRNNYIEWYADKGNWSSYNKLSNEALFAQAFYRVRKSGIVTSLSAGDTVVIFNPANSKALSSEYTGNYNKGTDVTLTDGKMAGYTKADIWTVGVNEDGTYTFSTSEGKKLSMTTQYSSMPLDKENPNWEVTTAKTENCFYIKNTGRNNYIEWYADKGNWSSYNKLSNEALFAQQFYLVVDDGGSDKPSGDLPKPGDKVVIYNQNAQAVLAEQNDNTDSPAINKAAATITEDGKTATPANGAVVFTVEQSGDYYRFKSEAYGYLCSNGTGNNAFYSKTASEDADWTVRECSGGVGGYEMESRTAKFNGKYSQYLEYYSDSFKTYSMNKVTDYTIYSFFFYPVAESVNVDGGLVVQPTITFPETMLPAYVGDDYEFDLEIDTIYAINDPWIEYSVKKADGTYIPGISQLQGNTDVEVLDGFTTGKGRVHITVFDSDIAEAAEAGGKMTLTFAFKDVKNNIANASYVVEIKDEPVISNVTPAQGAQTQDNKQPTISADIVNAGADASVTMTVNDTQVTANYDGRKVTYTPSANLPDGTVRVKVTVERKDGKTAAKTWSFTIGTAEFQLYFGQLHSHTQYSDGSGTLNSALDYIGNLPENANIDFVAFTDHSNYFDSKTNPNDKAALYDTKLVKDSDANHSWATYKKTVADFNESHSNLIALAGFEMTWSGGPGHINTFNTPGIVSRNNTELNSKENDAGMKAYYALLSQEEGADSISQFNHPGKTFGTFKDFSYWDPVIDSRMYMVEVGNGEGQIGAGGYYPSYSEYIKALDKGWHLAPTNNQDNHKGKWGNANDARDVILTDDFTEQGIYRAIRAMRVYATEDKNLEITYTVNGQQLGSIITEKPKKLNVSVTVYDPDKTDSIVKVELVANSGIVAHTWSDPAELASGKVEAELDPKYSYYFVRVTEGDGDLAVTAPVWVGETLKLGISSVECGTETPVTNEALTITTTLFNSEKTAAAIKSVSYTVNGKAIDGTPGGASTVPASGTAAVTFQYTPTAARVMTVTVTAVLELNGEEYTFTKDIELDVLDADSLVYIGIDASHDNEYVAGNYKDSMGNFGSLAADYSVRTVTLNTSEELIAACSNPKYKALILTVPSRRNGDSLRNPYKTYSDAEISAINDFNEKGGMVVLAGWSDYYESYGSLPAADHMAAQQNKVLAALGSSLRISDNGTVDDTLNGGQPQRLYFSSYNLDHILMTGVEYNAQYPNDVMYTERFSQYGGASIYAVGTDGKPTSELPGTVDPMVYGHVNTYVKDQDSDGGAAGTPKYTFAENDKRLLIMATEQLTGRGMIVVAGAAFMSNFEVQAQLDNGAEKNYSNYKICENLVQLLNPVKITPIKTVQAEPDEGVKFTVEGIVTSNASGYNKDTAFFDCIYVQDDTAGINAFPVAGNFKIGDKVRVTGTTSSYQGERQLAVTKIEKIADAAAPAPKDVTAAQINNGSVLGSLVRIKGTITRVETAEGKIQTIMVKDAAGNEARVFIDGYITTDKEVQDAIVGYQVEAVGLASYDNTFVLSDGAPVYPRIRIRDRSDITCTKGSSTIDPPAPVIPVTPSKPGNTGTTGTTLRFDDVSRSDWFYDDVRYVYENGIMDGTGAYRFAPNAQLTRAMIVTILYRMAGSPAMSGASDFKDVDSNKWFAKAVAWAAANGIVNGYGSGRFGPNDPVTREQLAAILYRYTAYRKASAASNGDNLASFSDLGTVSGYALESMNWAVGAGLLKGANGKLDPKANATRAQVAAIIHRYLER